MSNPSVNSVSKRILLIDVDDTRRQTRVQMLKQAGYDVVLRTSHIDAESLDHEGHFDLILLTLHRKKLDDAAAYSERLRKQKANLPILLLTDYGVFVPRGTLSPSIETGQPEAMIREITSMIAGSTHIRELDIDGAIVEPSKHSNLQR